MKRTIPLSILALILLTAGMAVGQNKKETGVPEAVKKAFRTKYPNSYAYEWEWKKKEKLFEAEFIDKEQKYEAYFTSQGDWVKTEKEISKKHIPKPVFDYISSSPYSDWEIDDAEEHHTPEHALIYEVKMEKGKRELYLYFLPDGKLINQKPD